MRFIQAKSYHWFCLVSLAERYSHWNAAHTSVVRTSTKTAFHLTLWMSVAFLFHFLHLQPKLSYGVFNACNSVSFCLYFLSQVCLEKLQDLQLALVISRLYESEFETASTYKKILQRHVLGHDKQVRRSMSHASRALVFHWKIKNHLMSATRCCFDPPVHCLWQVHWRDANKKSESVTPILQGLLSSWIKSHFAHFRYQCTRIHSCAAWPTGSWRTTAKLWTLCWSRLPVTQSQGPVIPVRWIRVFSVNWLYQYIWSVVLMEYWLSN